LAFRAIFSSGKAVSNLNIAKLSSHYQKRRPQRDHNRIAFARDWDFVTVVVRKLFVVLVVLFAVVRVSDC